MSIEHEDIFARLAAPFAAHEVKIRPQAGRQLHYITARTVMNRLDEVLGPANWWDEYEAGEHSVLCKLTICLPDGKVLTKQDAGGYAGMSDQGDDDKSGYSDSFKRAAVKFGVGRYLYRDGVPEFVRERLGAEEAPLPKGTHGDVSATGNLPGPHRRHQQRDDSTPVEDRRDYGGQPPTSGKALFAWVKNQEQRHEVALLAYLNKWGKLQDYPSRMVDWDREQVSRAHAEAMRKVQAASAEIDAVAAREV